MMRAGALLLAVALLLAAPLADAQQLQASAELRNAAGQVVGTARFVQTAQGVQVQVTVSDIDPGVHGIHIHAVGRCEGPDFMSASGHFNPDGRQHGFQNPQGPHAGDLPNLQVAANRAGTLSYTNPRVTLGAGPTSLFDADGSALVVHANPDDDRTDPAGNSGARIACGVIALVGPGGLPRTGEAGPATLALAALGLALLVGGAALRRTRRA